MSDKTEEWIINWFNEKYPDKASNIHPDIEYYKAGIIDSFGIVELISEIEDHFQMQFLDDDFHCDEFKTISGLAKIIDGKRS